MCDVPSSLYSFSFAPKPDWTCTYPSQPEIWTYPRECAKSVAPMPHIRFNGRLEDPRLDDSSNTWHVRSKGGAFISRFLILGVGPLSEPKLPSIPGIERVAGITFHFAQ